MKDAPIVSVVMPVHNGVEFIGEAIDSVRYQTLSDFELIVVDDGSTDDTPQVIASRSDARIRYVRLKRSGLVGALNHGFSLATGRFIARFDADDVCYNDRLRVQVNELERRKDVDVVCSDIVRIDKQGNQVGAETCRKLNSETLKASLLYQSSIKPVVHPTVMMRREVHGVIGGYRNYHCAEDHDYWLRCVDRFRFARINQPLVSYRVNPDGVSLRKSAEQMASAILSGVNYEVLRGLGVDMYADAPELWTSLGSSLLLDASHMCEALEDFRQLKEALGRGQLGRAAVVTLLNFATSRGAMLPSRRRASHRRSLNRHIAMASATLTHLGLRQAAG